MRVGLVALAALLSPATAGAQEAPAQAASDVREPDDIVVEGYRFGKPRDSRAQPPSMVSTVQSRRNYEYSEMLAGCAARSKLSSLSRLRAVVDGEVNSATHAVAQDRLKRIYITCSLSPSLLSVTTADRSVFDAYTAATGDVQASPSAMDAAPLGRSIYDRGAFTIQAMKLFAPDLKLTRRDTNDPEVQARFTLREAPRNRFRLPLDHRYFEVATCIVQRQPELATRLALGRGPARFTDVQEALIDRTRVCLGGARRVQVDPTQFRLYVADAVYRWTVAARNVGSLIPRTEVAALRR